MTYLILDAIVLVLLLLFAYFGLKRGFILSLCGFLAVLVAVGGASFAAKALTPKVSTALEPRIAVAIEQALQQQVDHVFPDPDATPTPVTPAVAAPSPLPVDPTLPPDSPLSGIFSLLKGMGLYETLIDSIDDAISQGMTSVAAEMAATIATSLASSVAYMVIFLLAFLLILLLWSVFSHALNLVARLPGLNMLNRVGGGLLGLLNGVVLLFVAAWVLHFLGNVIPEETVQQTHLLRFFMTTNPLSLLTGVQ